MIKQIRINNNKNIIILGILLILRIKAVSTRIHTDF